MNDEVLVAQKPRKKGGLFAEIEDDELKVKFDRSAVQAILSPGEEVLVTARGKLASGVLFE